MFDFRHCISKSQASFSHLIVDFRRAYEEVGDIEGQALDTLGSEHDNGRVELFKHTYMIDPSLEKFKWDLLSALLAGQVLCYVWSLVRAFHQELRETDLDVDGCWEHVETRYQTISFLPYALEHIERGRALPPLRIWKSLVINTITVIRTSQLPSSTSTAQSRFIPLS